ncbi:MAG: RHS repeat-associated core domain-containing protein, partial [Gammaproteobacteria bacterium]
FDGTDLNYTFDAVSRLTGAEGITLGYDANGRITGSNGLIITRDTGGRIATVTIAPGKTITYTYDSRNRLTQVADWLGGTTTFAYDDARRLTSIARPNGVTTTYTYDNDSRLTGIAEGVISNIALTRDGKGQITAAARNLPLSVSQVSTYTYDSAGRLTNDGTRSYTWDMASRMTSRTEGADSVTFTYDAASQLSTYTYDSMGRRTNDSTRTYTWDLASRMTSYTEGAGTVTFTYDALGHRVSRTEGGATRSYVWNYAFGLPSVSVMSEGGNDLRYYVYTPGGSLLYSIEAADNIRRDYHYDEMGNTIFLTDDAGVVIGSYAYTPYGMLTAYTGSLDNPFTWQGQYGIMAEGNGLYYVRARYYDANTGRFISRDPIKAIGPRKINPYQYALANPLRFVDVTGKDAEADMAAAEAALDAAWDAEDAAYQAAEDAEDALDAAAAASEDAYDTYRASMDAADAAGRAAVDADWDSEEHREFRKAVLRAEADRILANTAFEAASDASDALDTADVALDKAREAYLLHVFELARSAWQVAERGRLPKAVKKARRKEKIKAWKAYRDFQGR